jgi:methylmalonyl-CoA mutase
MQDRLLADFPAVTFESWRAQVDKDLKGGDFEKRLVTATLEGFAVQPLYSARDLAPGSDPGGFPGLSPYRRGTRLLSRHGLQWDIRAEVRSPSLEQASAEIGEQLSGGAASLWLRFDRMARLGLAVSAATPEMLDGLPCASSADFARLLDAVDLARVAIELDAGGNASAIGAAYLAYAQRRGIAPAALRGSLGCDPLAALARDGALPYSLAASGELLGELAMQLAHGGYALRAVQVSSLPYHDAGASCSQEIACAIASGLAYLRSLRAAGLSVVQASAQIGFSVAVADDLFLEIAKLRALRLCWAKLTAAHGREAQSASIHAVTSQRTKTRRDPWVNMLRTTTEAFAAMVGGADALTTRGFDEVCGPSDEFARRIARNVHVVLNEEAHVSQVADAAGGSYYVEALTDQLARAAWQGFREIERRGGMAAALTSGFIAQDLAETARKRDQAVSKRAAPLTGISEFANLSEKPVRRAALDPQALLSERAARTPRADADAALTQLTAAKPGARAAALLAAANGASIEDLTRALAHAGADSAATSEPLPIRRQAEAFERLRDRSEQLAARGRPARAFLCNLEGLSKHKARAGFATGFLHAGGIAVIDNRGFDTPTAASQAFRDSGSSVAVICGSDEQYSTWVGELAPQLKAAGARAIVLAGRPGAPETETAFRAAGVTHFAYVGVDVVSVLDHLLNDMDRNMDTDLGVAP